MHVTYLPIAPPPQVQRAPLMLVHGKVNAQFAVYEHRIFVLKNDGIDGDFEIFYVGCCSLIDVWRTPDALRNTHFAKLAQGTIVSITIIATTENEHYAKEYATKHGRELQAPCNLYGGMRSPYHRVKCLDTGVTYNSASDCAKAMGVSQSSLSQHLRKMPGFKSVNGHRFEVVS